MNKIPHQLSHWRVDEVIEALSFRKVPNFTSNDRKKLDRKLRRLAPKAYEEGVGLAKIWDRLNKDDKKAIMKAYNNDIYGQKNPIDIQKYLEESKTNKLKNLVREEIRNIFEQEGKELMDENLRDLDNLKSHIGRFEQKLSDQSWEGHFTHGDIGTIQSKFKEIRELLKDVEKILIEERSRRN